MPAGGISVLHFLLIAIQLGLVLILLRQFQIESAAFLRVAALAFAAFAIHAFLPLGYRLPFFALTSLAGIGIALGFGNGAWLVGIGFVLIGICHLPFSFAVRGGLLLAVGAVLALQRAHLVPFPWPEAIWPILGSMFMFRMIVYFYDLRHDKAKASPSWSLSYFFMVPNACCPLFPVVDYKTFRRNYYDDDAYGTYQIGIDWMVRGVMHLVLYRVIYYHLTLAPFEVQSPADLTQYLVTNFLLYLRVSGLFHLVVGMLHLFGFRLPETHNRYLLASSFTDFWRRINIYWKDFMQKVFYYPAVFRLRKHGTTKALVLATMYVFFMTWFLHAYQWFWLRGTLLLVWQDILFWALLCGLVVMTSLYEIKHGRQRSLGKPSGTWRGTWMLALRTYATFWFICILWSFWTADSISDWSSLWSALRGNYTVQVLLYPVLVFAVILIGSIPEDTLRNLRLSEQDDSTRLRARTSTVICAVALVGVSIEGVSTRLGADTATFIHSLRSGQLSRLDLAKLERGYYENLMSVNRFNSQLWEVYTKKPANWLDVDNANLKRFVGGFVGVEMIPSFVSNTKYGTITTNRFGMRDQEYPLKPSAGTFRAAVFGPSTVMGWGVPDGQTFEALVEERLNHERRGRPFARYELLNMGVPGYDPPQQLIALDKALTFRPDAVLYFATEREAYRAARYVAIAAKDNVMIPYKVLREIVRKADIGSGMSEASALKQIDPYRRQVLSYVYRHIVEQCRAHGVVPVWIFLPSMREGRLPDSPEQIPIAEAAGFIVIDMEDAYQGQEMTSIRLTEFDRHPNSRGHQLIADRLYAELMARRDAIFQNAAR